MILEKVRTPLKNNLNTCKVKHRISTPGGLHVVVNRLIFSWKDFIIKLSGKSKISKQRLILEFYNIYKFLQKYLRYFLVPAIDLLLLLLSMLLIINFICERQLISLKILLIQSLFYYYIESTSLRFYHLSTLLLLHLLTLQFN